MVVRIVFRVDASTEIGTGHVMRCLTLAGALRSSGAYCHFICRELPGNLIKLIRSKNYTVDTLPITATYKPYTRKGETVLAHEHWLGSTQLEDVKQCLPILSDIRPQWLVVDHYALDATWENKTRDFCERVMVIDDLADRFHQCDLLLDQTLGRRKSQYSEFVPEHSQLLCGPRYALLRAEFSEWRSYSLQRRSSGRLQSLLINMGGVDKDNLTGVVLDTLKSFSGYGNHVIRVVMGGSAPWLKDVKVLADSMPVQTEVLVGVDNMAQLMAESDMAIGAAGATAWERCCVGLPSLMFVLAENQRLIARSLERAGAARVVDLQGLKAEIWGEDEAQNSTLAKMSARAASIVDGAGTKRVIEHLLRK